MEGRALHPAVVKVPVGEEVEEGVGDDGESEGELEVGDLAGDNSARDGVGGG